MDNISEALLWIAMGGWALALAFAAAREGASRVRVRGWPGVAQVFAAAALLAHAAAIADVGVGCLAVLWMGLTVRAIRQDMSASSADAHASPSAARRGGKRPELRVIRGGATRPSPARSVRGTHVRPNA